MIASIPFSHDPILFAGPQRRGLRGLSESKGTPPKKNGAALIEDLRALWKWVEGNLVMLMNRHGI